VSSKAPLPVSPVVTKGGKPPPAPRQRGDEGDGGAVVVAIGSPAASRASAVDVGFDVDVVAATVASPTLRPLSRAAPRTGRASPPRSPSPSSDPGLGDGPPPMSMRHFDVAPVKAKSPRQPLLTASAVNKRYTDALESVLRYIEADMSMVSRVLSPTLGRCPVVPLRCTMQRVAHVVSID
jgi:hypothetical protein